MAFLARHDVGHRLMPSELNFRANIYGFKVLGVEAIISASAVGSLREELRAARSRASRISSSIARRSDSDVLRNGIGGHVGFAHPVCDRLRQLTAGAAKRASAPPFTARGTYVCMEGPQFSTLAESNLYRSWGADIIGMTNLQEAKLAREAEICYATMALVTDYDCWHPDHDSVTVELIVQNLIQNAKTAQRVIAAAVEAYAVRAECGCGRPRQRDHHRPEAIAGAQVKKDSRHIIGKLRQMKHVVTGSIAFDYLMSFPASSPTTSCPNTCIG